MTNIGDEVEKINTSRSSSFQITAKPHTHPTASSPNRATLYAWYVLLVMFLVYALSLLDRQILSILAEEIKKDLLLTDAQLGFLFGTAFAIFYTVFGLPLGRLADNWRRGWLMAIGLGLWSIMTALSGLATNYGQLAAARIGVGIGEASASPAAYSMLAATFPRNRRALAVSIYSAGSFVGAGLSLPLGGWISDTWNIAYSTGTSPFGFSGWQVAFLVVGLPGLLVAIWVLSLREPPRFSEDGIARPVVSPDVWRKFFSDLISILPPFTLLSAARHPGGLILNLKSLGIVVLACSLLIYITGDLDQWLIYFFGFYAVISWGQSLKFTDPPAYELFWTRRMVALCVIGLGLAGTTYNCFVLWASPFAIRTFEVSASEVGMLIGIPGAVAAASGAIIGGWLADWWKQRSPGGRLYTCMLAAGVPIPLVLFMFTRDTLSAYLFISPVIYFFTGTIIGGAVTALQDLVLPRMYGTVGALFLVGQTLTALSVGPYVSGKIATITGSLQIGLFTILIAPATGFFILWYIGRRMKFIESNKLIWAKQAGEA